MKDTEPTSTASTPFAIAGMAVSILIAGLAVAALLYFDVEDQVLQLLRWLDRQGLEAALIFILIMAVVVIFLLPGVLFTTGAGFVFGVTQGTVLVVLGTTLGAGFSFLIARRWFGERAARWAMSHSRMGRYLGLLQRRGFHVVLCTRLVPFFPSKLSNYVFGLTPVPFRHYLGGSFLGFIPLSLHNVYVGSLAADIATLNLQGENRSILEWGLYGGGLLVIFVVLFYLARYARRSLDSE